MADRREHFGEPLTTVSTGQVVVAVPGVRVQLHAGLPCVVVSIAARSTGLVEGESSNVGWIYIGGAGVTSANGRILEPGDVIDMAIDNLNRLYIDADVAGDGISYLALA
jgi:hypothetical protein